MSSLPSHFIPSPTANPQIKCNPPITSILFLLIPFNLLHNRQKRHQNHQLRLLHPLTAATRVPQQPQELPHLPRTHRRPDPHTNHLPRRDPHAFQPPTLPLERRDLRPPTILPLELLPLPCPCGHPRAQHLKRPRVRPPARLQQLGPDALVARRPRRGLDVCGGQEVVLRGGERGALGLVRRVQGDGGRAERVRCYVAEGPGVGGLGEYEAGEARVVEAYGLVGVEEGEEGVGGGLLEEGGQLGLVLRGGGGF
jgi:hypothetical protein